MIAPIAAKPVLPRNPRRLKLKLFPLFAAFRPVSRAMIFFLFIAGFGGFLAGIPQGLPNWLEYLHFAALRKPGARCHS
jgi:hypothetical protein